MWPNARNRPLPRLFFSFIEYVFITSNIDTKSHNIANITIFSAITLEKVFLLVGTLLWPNAKNREGPLIGGGGNHREGPIFCGPLPRIEEVLLLGGGGTLLWSNHAKNREGPLIFGGGGGGGGQ